MAFGIGCMRFPPHAFWRMTLREMAAAMRGMLPESERPPGRDTIAALMRRYPDE